MSKDYMRKDIVFLKDEGGDWEAMYIDGVKVAEGHQLKWWHVLVALGVRYQCQEMPNEVEGAQFQDYAHELKYAGLRDYDD